MSEAQETQANPLSGFFRRKSVFVDLPSRGLSKYYPSGIKLSTDGELGIMPMTNNDEIKLKSPDALFNAEAVVDLFRSTVPDIADPMEIPACDRDLILLGIQHATRGSEFSVASKCPNCKKESEYTADLGRIIASAQPIPEDNTVKISQDDSEMIVEVKPYNYRAHIKSNMLDFQYARMELINNADSSNEEKAQLFSEAIASAAALTVQIVSEAIIRVTVKQGDDTQVVENPDHVFEWVENIDSPTYKLISTKIAELGDPKINTEMDVKCTHCEHPYTTVIDLDPQRLF